MQFNPANAMISVRATGGTHIARAIGLNITASCTMGYEHAAKACAAKVYPTGYTIKKYGGIDTMWIAYPQHG